MDGQEQFSRGLQTSAMGLVVNALLGVVKLVGGLLGNSSALVADAVESMADVLGSIIIWSGLRIAAEPADERHPYGHGKAEAIAALAVSLLLVGAGIGIGVEAVFSMLRPRDPPKAFTLIVLVAVIIVKEVLFRVVRRVAHETGSSAVHVDAWHHRSDAITSGAAAVGIAVALLGGRGYEQADDWAAMVAAGVIVFNGVRLTLAPLHELMDAEPRELIEQVRSVAAAVPGVMFVEKVRARKSSMRFWVDMHVEVDPGMPVREAHALTGKIKAAVRGAIPSVKDVLIHVEPHGHAATESQPMPLDAPASDASGKPLNPARGPR
jgi:cation diffusion facilitator family transporter